MKVLILFQDQRADRAAVQTTVIAEAPAPVSQATPVAARNETHEYHKTRRPTTRNCYLIKLFVLENVSSRLNMAETVSFVGGYDSLPGTAPSSLLWLQAPIRCWNGPWLKHRLSSKWRLLLRECYATTFGRGDNDTEWRSRINSFKKRQLLDICLRTLHLYKH